MPKQLTTQTLESMLHTYIERAFDLANGTSFHRYNINVHHIPASIQLKYNYDRNEVAMQQIPRYTVQIKHDLTRNFGLKIKGCVKCKGSNNYIHAYPRYFIFQIIDRDKLITNLCKYFGFNGQSEYIDNNNTSDKSTIKHRQAYDLPKYVCFDVRSTLCAKKTKFDVTLVTKFGKKRTSTKTTTILEGMTKVAENRVANGVWLNTEAEEYMKTYDPSKESLYSLDLACAIADVKIEDVLDGTYHKNRYGYKKALPKRNEEAILDEWQIFKEENNIVPIATDNKKCLLKYLKENPQWTPIANFPSFEIFSAPYKITSEKNIQEWTYHVRDRITKRTINPEVKSNGMCVALYNIIKPIYVLAADTFIHNPYKIKSNNSIITEIHHINGDHNDNRLENLMHVTRSEHLAAHKKLKEKALTSTLTPNQILQIRAARQCGNSYKLIAKRLGFEFAQVKRVCTQKLAV